MELWSLCLVLSLSLLVTLATIRTGHIMLAKEVYVCTCDTNLLCSHQNSLYNSSDYDRVNLTVTF